jgi:hypothetical protein
VTRRARQHGGPARRLLAAAAALAGCTVALDFGPAALLPPRDGSVDAAAFADAAAIEAGADVTAIEAGADVADASARCDADLASSSLHCGACNRACEGSARCAMGACRGNVCSGSLEPCGALCVDLRSDARNCGACAAECGAGTPRCCRGVCAARCP